VETLRAAPFQVSLDHVSREVVRKHPGGSGLDERQAPQPVEKLAGVADHERLGKPILGGDAEMRADLKGSSV
jgi:hypothetical protein